MSAVDESSKVVYVGHLPFDMTEEQIKDIFKTAGPVKQIRLVFDRATGKSKGFAFVQYFQPESAESAVRNLDKHKVGNKQLRVNYSSGKFFDGKNSSGKHDSNGGMPGEAGDDEMSGIVPEIVDFVSTVPPPQKQQMLNELKQFISEKPDVSRKFLEQNPQVTYAVVQCMFELGKIDGTSASALILNDQMQNSQPQPTQTPQLQQAPQQAPQQAQTPQPKQRKRPSRQASAPAPMLTTPRVELSEDQKQMYRQIVSLTPEQLSAMPTEQQQAALKIRSQVESGLISI